MKKAYRRPETEIITLNIDSLLNVTSPRTTENNGPVGTVTEVTDDEDDSDDAGSLAKRTNPWGSWDEEW